MEKDILKELRKEYKSKTSDLASKKNLLCRLFHQKEMIEDNPIVQEYLMLNRNIESLKDDIKSMETEVKEKTVALYSNICANFSDDRLYVYIDDVYDANENFCSYYFDVLSGTAKEVIVSDVEEFERKNNVIDLNSYISNSESLSNGFDCQGSDLNIADIVRIIQREFIMNSLEKGQDVAIQKMLTKARK